MSVDGHCLIWTCKSCSCLESRRERDDRWVGGWRRGFFCICTCICTLYLREYCILYVCLVPERATLYFHCVFEFVWLVVGGWWQNWLLCNFTIHHSSMCCVPTVLVDGRWCWQKVGSGASDRFSMDCSPALPTLFAKLCLISCLFAKLCLISCLFAKLCAIIVFLPKSAYFLVCPLNCV